MGSKKSTSVTTSDPYGPMKGYFGDASKKLTDYLNDPRSNEVYGGPRTIDPSKYTKEGMDALVNNKGYDQSRDYMSRVLGGEYVNAGNPHLDKVQGAVRSAVMPGLNSTFAKSGMIGSTMHQGTLARALTDGMAAPMFQNYENERNRQGDAARMLPMLDQSRAENLLTAGQIGEGYDREKMMSDWQKWQEQQDAPLRALQKTYGFGSDMGSRFGTQTQTSRQSGNPWETAAGIGMMGLGALGGMPWLSGIGGMMGAANKPWSFGGFRGLGNAGGWASPAQRG